MDDTRISEHIEQLVAEEHRLYEAHSEGDGLRPAEHDRLERIRVELDRYWELLRQRRARERAGLDPE
jgi:predicted nuclease with TOPRIM domain